MQNSRSSLRLGLAAAAASLMAGCSAASSSPGASSSPTQSALSGTQLSSVLLPASSMPHGFTLNPSRTRNTGSQLPSDHPQPVPASKVCQVFNQTAYIRAAGIETGVWAQSDFVNADHSQEIAQEIDVFTGTHAQQAMRKLWRAFGKCSSFSYHSNGTTVHSTLTRSRLSGKGDEAIKAVIGSPVFKGGITLVAIRMGSQIITTLHSSTGSDMGSRAVGYARQIAHRLQAAQ